MKGPLYLYYIYLYSSTYNNFKNVEINLNFEKMGGAGLKTNTFPIFWQFLSIILLNFQII